MALVSVRGDRIDLAGVVLGEPLAAPLRVRIGAADGEVWAHDGGLVLVLEGGAEEVVPLVAEVVEPDAGWDFEAPPRGRSAVRRLRCWRVAARWSERRGRWRLEVGLTTAAPWPSLAERRAERARAIATEASSLLDRLFGEE